MTRQRVPRGGRGHRLARAAGAGTALAAIPGTASAHSLPCTGTDAATTAVVAATAGVLLLRPWRRRGTTRSRFMAFVMPLVFAGLVTGAACAPKSKPASNRPTTDAKLQIVSPTANQVTGPNITVQLNLIGGKVVPQTSGPLRGDEGHIHVSIDGKIVTMAYSTTQDINGLAPGEHSLQAEFVATDHAPFKNRLVAAVLFKVQ
ncbi:MAG TPA: hypothetical protein VFA94_08720 [Acidimicrobiales bacterium]|nr:hypothetical protein [Acidimicrobiales bacterium]